jgi:hypothetical protein
MEETQKKYPPAMPTQERSKMCVLRKAVTSLSLTVERGDVTTEVSIRDGK